MAKIKTLLTRWESTHRERLTVREYPVRLPITDAARLEALAQLYPDLGLPHLITDLIGAALDEIEAALPYVPGKQITAEDEFGDPIYEDVGLSPRFHAFIRQITEQLEREVNASSQEK